MDDGFVALHLRQLMRQHLVWVVSGGGVCAVGNEELDATQVAKVGSVVEWRASRGVGEAVHGWVGHFAEARAQRADGVGDSVEDFDLGKAGLSHVVDATARFDACAPRIFIP